MDLAHQRIAAELNRAADDARAMDDIEREATPLFYAVMAIIAAVVLWVATAEYRDVAQHKLDTMADKQQYQRMSDALARCANGEAVKFDDGWLVCKVKRFKVAAK